MKIHVETAGGGGLVLLLGLVIVADHGGGISTAAIAIGIGAGVVVLAAIIVTAVVLVRRLRREIPSPEGFVRTLPGAAPHELPGQQPPAIEQHVHFHFGPGADPRAVDEILRRNQRPEQ